MDVKINNKKYQVDEVWGKPYSLDGGLIPCRDEDGELLFISLNDGEPLEVRGLWD